METARTDTHLSEISLSAISQLRVYTVAPLPAIYSLPILNLLEKAGHFLGFEMAVLSAPLAWRIPAIRINTRCSSGTVLVRRRRRG